MTCKNCYFPFCVFDPFCSILFYTIALADRRGTTDKFATIPFQLVLFSAALVELAKSIPVHSLIFLSSHCFFWLPLFIFPLTVPCRITFAKPEDPFSDNSDQTCRMPGLMWFFAWCTCHFLIFVVFCSFS